MFAHTELTKFNGNCTKRCTFVQFCASFLQFRVADTGVVDGFQLLDEHCLSVGDIAEGNGTILETAVGYLTVNQTINQLRMLFSV